MSHKLHLITGGCVVCGAKLGADALELDGEEICGASECARELRRSQRRLARAPSGAFHEHLVGRACAGCGMPAALHGKQCEVA